jgi:hypothetical protein
MEGGRLTDTIRTARPPQAMAELARALARAATRHCVREGIAFDMDDPQVVRDVMLASLAGIAGGGRGWPGGMRSRSPARTADRPRTDGGPQR